MNQDPEEATTRPPSMPAAPAPSLQAGDLPLLARTMTRHVAIVGALLLLLAFAGALFAR